MTTTMKAIRYKEYGTTDVLKLEQVPKPSPSAGQVLVKIHAASANAADWHLLRADPFPVRFLYGLFKPKYQILGCDVAGVVEAVGEGVTTLHVGDKVFGCVSEAGFGAYAEYVSAPQDRFTAMPTNASFEEAACLPVAALTALQGLKAANIASGKKVLIYGASGGVGTYAVQIAKAYDAEVTAVCSTKNLELMTSLGADHTVDYTKVDALKGGDKYDVILAANGDRSASEFKAALSEGGYCIVSGGTNSQTSSAMLAGITSGKKQITNLMMKFNPVDLKQLQELYEAGKIKSVIDKTYTLEEVPQAIAHVESGVRGKLAIQVVA